MACNKVTTQLYSVSHSELVLDTGHEGGREQTFHQLLGRKLYNNEREQSTYCNRGPAIRFK